MALRWVFLRFSLVFTTLFLGSSFARAYTPPPLLGAVNDRAAMLTQAERDALEKRLKAHRDAHGDEIVVFTVPGLGGESIEDVAYGTFNTWKIGQKGKDNGVLLVIAPTERKTRIETGKGVGDKITDLQSKRILSERVGPRLKEQKNFEGISAGVASIESLLTGGGIVPAGEVATTPPARKDPPTFEPSSVFVDTVGTFPAAERARFVAAYEARKKKGKAAFAVVIVQDALASEMSGICGYNIGAFSKAIPNVKGIVVATRSGTKLSQYTDSSTQGPGVKALSTSITALSGVLARVNGPARDQALVDGLVKALDGYDVELPGLWESPVFIVFFALLLLAVFIWIGMKLAPSGGGGGSGGSSSWSSSSSDSSSSGGYSGGGYSGGGGSSGGGGASDDY